MPPRVQDVAEGAVLHPVAGLGQGGQQEKPMLCDRAIGIFRNEALSEVSFESSTFWAGCQLFGQNRLFGQGPIKPFSVPQFVPKWPFKDQAACGD